MLDKIHIYLVPGLAASSDIFEYLEIPQDNFELHYLDWLVPLSQNESIYEYAKRMCALIKHENPVLVGVSFGGIMVQEMSKIISVKKTIIISSVKSKHELPRRLKFARVSKFYKVFPTKVITNIENYTKYAFGNTIKKRVQLYSKYLAMRDKDYLPWALHNVLNWQQENPPNDIVHIHGNKDRIFPIKHVKNCTVIEAGTHVMILNKARHISQLLVEVI
jgi:pimeloyl-ACP methyl ester carboxylesterase